MKGELPGWPVSFSHDTIKALFSSFFFLTSQCFPGQVCIIFVMVKKKKINKWYFNLLIGPCIGIYKYQIVYIR